MESKRFITNEIPQDVYPFFQSDRALDILKTIADTHAPSQTLHYTRAREIQRLLQKYTGGGFTFDPNYVNTGNALLSLGGRSPKILFIAHGDELSYLVGDKDKDSWSLIPFCNHLAEVEHSAIALRYHPSGKKLEQVAEGVIRRVDRQHKDPLLFFDTADVVQMGDRIVYHHPLMRDRDIVRGSMDNSAGIAACLLAVLALYRVAPKLPVAFAFTDEEEGPADSNSTFARGSRRLLRQLAPPSLCVVVDGHDISPWCTVGDGALFAEKASFCRGAVVPPNLYASFKELANDMIAKGIRIRENVGKVSRSDDVACIDVTPNVLLLGYPVENAHFNRGVPAASLDDIVNLAKVIFWVASESEAW